VAETQANYDDNQGSNVAFAKLTTGDEVWIAHYSASPYVFGSDKERTTTFSGALVYEVEP